jgi:hypothetical protein
MVVAQHPPAGATSLLVRVVEIPGGSGRDGASTATELRDYQAGQSGPPA